ncbi:T9SS type A sorting domain-containing protein [Litoribacter ruber]|uniref:DUF4961 domain-containing protein n=1 Tax=Litoribacter ruber TaxID=702568 RepID=UPI001BDB0635|nr:alpha-amylase family glycosyl hydrolase [Litoribacter ruber]MBT0810580.1 T9SS type A sorting domain-containing protein [Litoribacter ruber]
MKATFTSLLLWVIVLLPVAVQAQITTDPEFPKANAPLTIRYDATQGTSGLQGADQVYVHLGAVIAGPNSTSWEIVPFDWGQDIEEARMSRVEGDIWEYTLTPNELFEPSSEQTIYRIGLVFRNRDGSREGKTETHQDFFINLSQGFDLQFTEPTRSTVMLEIGDSQNISFSTSDEGDLSLEINGSLVASEANSSSLDYTFIATEAGNFEVLAKAVANGETAERSMRISVVAESPRGDFPIGARKGINYNSDTEVTFVLEAPGKKNVFLIGDFNDWQVDPDYQMTMTPDGEMFWFTLTDVEPGREYIFQYLVDGDIRIGDPYADKTSDPFHDQEIIDQNRYPGLLPFPDGQTEFQATYFQTAQQPYEWKHLNYEKPAPEELVIYELLVRDFDDRRTYKAVTERLDYLQDLGINALELMPIKEFEGNLSWGYNPSFFFAPDKFYGTKNDLKELIDEAHKRGMVVLLDMVLNHAFGQSPFVRLYNDGDYGAPTEDNPWLNRVARHPFNVGYDFNHESPYTREFVDSVNNYWLTEYKFDGYRFDLSKGFTQVNSGDDVGLWSQLDESRIEIWKHIYDRIKANHPDAYVILEHFADNSEETILADYGMMLWGNMNHPFREMGRGLSRNFNGAYYETRNWSKNHLIAYMESHDEERVMFETLTRGATSPVNLRNLTHAVNRKQLLTAFYFGIPGPKMIWQFGEFGYDVELNDDRLGIKPTKWEYLDDEDRLRLYYLYRAMIRLKDQHEVFNRPEEVNLSLNGLIKTISLKHTDMDVFVVGNFGLEDAEQASVNFPSSGVWYDYLSGEQISVGGSIYRLDFAPNQFHIFTSVPLEKPEEEILFNDPILSVEEKPSLEGLKLYPVPASNSLNIELPNGFGQANYRIMDVTGQMLQEGSLESEFVNVGLQSIRPGVYVIEMYNSNNVVRKRFVKE